jgi:hypothetical protein
LNAVEGTRSIPGYPTHAATLLHISTNSMLSVLPFATGGG